MIQAIDVCINPFFPEFKDKYSRFGYWKFLDGGAYQKAQKSWTVEKLIQSMDEASVDGGLVAFCASSPANGEDCFIPAASLKPILDSHSGRLFGIVGVNPLLTDRDGSCAAIYRARGQTVRL